MNRVWIFVVVLAACQSRSELVIGVATDIKAPDLLDRVELQIARSDNGVVQIDTSWTITGRPNMPDNLPGSFGVAADDTRAPLDIVLKGWKGETELVNRHAIIGLVDGQTLFYRVGLTVACVDRTDCPATTTCVEGSCRPVVVDPATLPDYDEELTGAVSCQSFATFIDTATGQPMPATGDASACAPDQCVEGTCLKPPPGGTRDVTVLAIDTNVQQGTFTFTPQTGTTTDDVEALVPDGHGGVTRFPSMKTGEGVFTIAGVPVGRYYLRYFTNYAYTTLSTFDFGSDTYARPGHQQLDPSAYASTTLALSGSGMDAYKQSDSLFMFSVSANDYWGGVDDTGIADGSTAFSGLTMTHGSATATLLSAADDLRIQHLTYRTGTSAAGTFGYWATAKVMTAAPFAETPDAQAAVAGTFESLPADSSLVVDLPAVPWRAAVGEAADGHATYLSPQAVRYPNTADAPYLVVRERIGGLSFGPYPPYVSLLEVNGIPNAELVTPLLAYASIPAVGEITGQFVSVVDDWYVPVALPGLSATGFFAFVEADQRLGDVNGPFAPIVGPVRAPTVNGLDAFGSLSGVGTTPTIAWQPPEIGRPSEVAIAIYELGAAGTATTATFVAQVFGSGAEVVVPPGLIVAGRTYALAIFADNVPNGAAPFRNAFPYGASQIVTGLISP